MRRLITILLTVTLVLAIAPAIFAQEDHSSTTTAAAEGETHAQPHGEGAAAAGEHHEKTYFGMPAWVLKLANMLLFIGVLIYFAGGPVKRAFADRSAAIARAAEEARERREKADRMAGDIQARLTAIEAEVKAIHERAVAEGERQKRELIAAAEAESQKILASARNEVENRLKHARTELTEFAGQLASERAEQILREKMTADDQKKLFTESLREVSNA